MQRNNSQPLVLEQTYKASPEKVWRAITEKEQMKQWYFDLDAFRAEPGFEFSFPGQGHKGENYIHRCKILEVVEMKKLSYSWAYEGYQGYSVVTFELFPEGDGTRLRLTHSGLDSFPADNPDFAKRSFNGGWTELVTRLLKNFVEKA